MFMQCFEWWAFELIVLMSGAIGVIELAVQTLVPLNFSQLFVVCFTFCGFDLQGEAGKFGYSSRIKYTCVYGGVPKGPQASDLRNGTLAFIAISPMHDPRPFALIFLCRHRNRCCDSGSFDRLLGKRYNKFEASHLLGS